MPPVVDGDSEESTCQINESLPLITWPGLPEMPELTGSTIPITGRRFLMFPPSTILKLGVDEGEALMTALGHDIVGDVVPMVSSVVEIAGPRIRRGILMTRQPGTPLAELWPTLGPAECTAVKSSIVQVLSNMRKAQKCPKYFGRPGGRPYVLPNEYGQLDAHAFCHTRADWDQSRVQALHDAALDTGISGDRMLELEQTQLSTATGGAVLVDSPVLTHGDLSDRNILVDPSTYQVTGLIDWESANIAPAYFEYVSARLCEGHESSWRKTLLEILREVLRVECKHECSLSLGADNRGHDGQARSA